MTFLDAAIAILQREGRPLHYKQLTEIAVQENLLTVIGRTPEATMQQRLNDALKKADPASLLVRDKPGVYGLRYYPAKTGDAAKPETKAAEQTAAVQAPEQAAVQAPESVEPSAAPATDSAAHVEASADAGAERNEGRRRRGGRGRRKGGEVEAGVAQGASDREATLPVTAARAEAPAAPTATEARPAGEGVVPERRSFAEAAAVVQAAHRRLDAERARNGAQPAEAQEPTPAPIAAPFVPAAAKVVGEGPVAGGPAVATLEDEDEELEHTTGPVMAPAFGTEELVRGEENRRLYEEPRERNRYRDRRDRHDRDRRDHERQAQRPPESAEARGPAPARPAEVSAAEPVSSSPIQAVVDILRNTDGRPMHLRQIVEMALKRKLLRGDVHELVRLLRGVILIDGREREAAGLRPRVKNAGGTNYVIADRRLEPELAQQERELGERADRLTEATRKTLLRRIGRLPAPGFETLMRLLLARLGLVQAEAIKRGEGVCYFSAERPQSQGRRRRVLVAMWPGEAELGRRAVGELRTGIEARGFDEGLLLSAGRAGADALAELTAAGGAITMCDGDELGALCVRHGVGATRRSLPMVTLDLDLLGELTEG